MSEVLHLTLHRKWFADIVSRKNASNIGKKSPIGVKDWKDENTTLLNFRNGYGPNAPEILVRVFVVSAGTEKDSKAHYAILLGRILEIKHGETMTRSQIATPVRRSLSDLGEHRHQFLLPYLQETHPLVPANGYQ